MGLVLAFLDTASRLGVVRFKLDILLVSDICRKVHHLLQARFGRQTVGGEIPTSYDTGRVALCPLEPLLIIRLQMPRASLVTLMTTPTLRFPPTLAPISLQSW